MYETNIATTLSQSEAFNHLSALLIPVVLFLVQSCPVHSKGVLKAEMMETLVYGCVTWTLGKEHFAELQTERHRFLLRISGFQRRQRTDHLMPYAEALKKAQCESVETTTRKRRLLFAGGRAADAQ